MSCSVSSEETSCYRKSEELSPPAQSLDSLTVIGLGYCCDCIGIRNERRGKQFGKDNDIGVALDLTQGVSCSYNIIRGRCLNYIKR